MLEAVRDLCASGAVVGADDLTPAMLTLPVVDAGPALAAVRVCKTPDEVECIRRAQQINEEAIADVAGSPPPGERQSELTGRFLAAAYEHGATANVVEPIWQVADRAAPHLVFPLAGDDRTFAEDDLVLVDTGVAFHGYVSDYGRTWGGLRAHFERWRDVTDAVLGAVRPGATALDLVRAAPTWDGRRPWLDHLYLAHGTGTASAEEPLVGSDLGDAHDEALELRPGMVLVLEPVVWEPGVGGYRAEETVAVTETGWEMLGERVTW